jgi:Nucleotidyl transferase of unknown function (DUF2204)
MVKKLSDGGIDFVLVGGFAAVAHGVSLVTRDVDICFKFSPETLLRLQEVLADVHPKHRLTPQRLPLQLTERQCADLKNLYLETDLCVLDCLGEVAGLGDYDAVLKQSVQISTKDGTFRILDIDALIRAKEAMNRPHDRLTVAQLKAIKERRGRRS